MLGRRPREISQERLNYPLRGRSRPMRVLICGDSAIERIDQHAPRLQATREFFHKKCRGELGLPVKGARIINPLIAEITEHDILYWRLLNTAITPRNHDSSGAVSDEFGETIDEHKLRNVIGKAT